jgi:hypothetical protein
MTLPEFLTTHFSFSGSWLLYLSMGAIAVLSFFAE